MMRVGQIIGTLPATRKNVAPAVALLFCLLLAPQIARASCGDYVFIRDAQGRLVRASSLATPGTACTGPNCHGGQMAEETHVPPPSLPIKLPCNGPNCSGNNQLPAVPVPPPAPQRSSQESSALPVTGEDSYQPASLFEYAGSARQHEIHHPQSIFHPPR